MGLTCMDGTVAPDTTASFVAIEVKRRAGIDAVDQLLRYMECLERDPYLPGRVRGMVVAQTVIPQARAYAETKGVGWKEVDYDQLRGLAPVDLRLF